MTWRPHTMNWRPIAARIADIKSRLRFIKTDAARERLLADYIGWSSRAR